MRRKLKQICVFVLLVSLFFSGFSNEAVSASAAETNSIVTGNCGENVYFELNTTTGVMRIYGTGPMKDYGISGALYAPWIKEYAPIITKVKIEDGVTSVGNRAFCGSPLDGLYICTNLHSVDISNTVTKIGEHAFSACKSLKSINIPDSVQEIKRCAFQGSYLSDIHWGNSVQILGEYAFFSTKFTDLHLPSQIQNIGELAFCYCDDLEAVEIPDNCEVGNKAFAYCNVLERVTFGENCKIHGEIFRMSPSLHTISIGEGSISVSSNNNDDYGTFRNCMGLETILLPDSWEFYDGTSQTKAYCAQFGNCANLKNISLKNSNKKYKIIDDVVYSKDSKKIIYYPLSLNSSEYEILDGVEEINSSAFAGQSYLEHISIPSTVHEIGSYAFQGCNKLNNVIVPEGVVELKAGTFAYCPELKKMVWPVSLEKLGGNAKEGSYTFQYTDLEVVYGESGSYAERRKEEFRNTIYCFFNANGGTVTEERKPVIYNDKYHKLPEPMREGYQFLGWYTEKEAGDMVVKDTVVTKDTAHTLYAHWKANTTAKKSIGETTVTLEKTNYVYDGKAKRPSVNVKDGSTTLINEIHYTVSYENNVNAGTATVIIIGIGEYTGTVSKTFTISAKKKDFVWSRDNWNFNNSSYQGYFSSGKYIDQINSTYLNKLKGNLTNSEYKAIFDSRTGWLYDTWAGSCYGMSSTCFLAMENFLPYSDYKSGASSLYQLNYPLADSNTNSLITYYQMLQVKSVTQQQYRTVPNKSNKENIQSIISLLGQNNTVMIGFKKNGWGGHAILAYGYEYGSYTWNGVSYQGCIKICDPNSSREYSEKCNIYFNTSTYNWIIPYYSNVPITSVSGAKFNYVGADVNVINYGGYLSGSSDLKITDYVARIDAAAVSDNRSVTKVREENGNYISQNNAPGDIIEDYSYVLGGKSEGTVGYNLYDAKSAYKLSQNNAEKLQLSMDYEDCYLEGGSAAGNNIIFDKDGYVSVSGESADYNISMTFDDDYPTDWFTIQINGENSDEVSLEKENNGYILSGDNLENVKVNVNNKEDSAYVKFTTKYPSAYIYEINEETVGVKVDTDHNGTYETLLNAEHTHKNEDGWKFDAKNHWKECECGQKSEEKNHEFQWIVDIDAKVFNSGLKHEECIVCGYKRNENTVIEKLSLGDSVLPTVSPVPEPTKTPAVYYRQGSAQIGKVKIISSQSRKKGKIVLRWESVKSVTGYQIQYSLKRNFSKKKTKITKSNKISLKKLKSKRKYYIRVRAFKQEGKSKYGKWSKVKKVKVK